MSRRMTPRRGFWLGVVLTLLGLAVGIYLVPAMITVGDQALGSSNFVRFVSNFFGGALLPLGMTFMVLSLVARALDHRPVISAADLNEDLEDTPSWPPLVSSRFALVSGLVLLVIGLVCQFYMTDWFQAIQADATFFRDFVVYLLPLLNQLMLPLGVLLIPCAWILRIIEERQISNVRAQVRHETL